MNRQQRRAAKAAAKHRSVDTVTAIHEAGHAVGRYLTAAEMGYPEDEAITEINTHSSGDMYQPMTSHDGRAILASQAVTMGPKFSREIEELSTHVTPPGKMFGGEDAAKYLTECMKCAKEKGADIDRWLKARAVISVFGPAAEAVATETPFMDVWESYGAETDVRGLIEDSMIAGKTSVDEISALEQQGLSQVLEYLSKTEVCNAVEALANHIHRHGTTSGRKAASIIRKALTD